MLDYLTAILSRKNPLNVVNEVLSNPNRLAELILDCSVTVNRQTLKLDEDIIREVEQLSMSMCYQKRCCEIMGLILRKWKVCYIDSTNLDQVRYPVS